MGVRDTVNIDLARRGATPVFYAKQYDAQSRQLAFRLFSGGIAYTPPEGTAAVFRAGKPDGTGVFYDGQINDNTVTVELVQQVTAAAGNVLCEVSLMRDKTRLSTFNAIITVEASPVSDEQIVSSDYYTALQSMINTIMHSATVVKPLGSYDTVEALQSAVTSPDIGDMYIVGTQTPYHFYFWDGSAWSDAGVLSGAPGPQGDAGPYFTPSVSADGVLTWDNGAGLENPPPVLIKGPKGDTGSGLVILGYYETLADLQSAIPAPETGAAYGVGVSAPYDIYVYAGQWVNNGPIQGPAGAAGADGADGAQGEPGPNLVSGQTETALDGILRGDGAHVTVAQAGTDYALPTAAIENDGAAQTLALLDNREYTFSVPLTSLVLSFPAGRFESWLAFTVGEGFVFTPPAGAKVIGSIPGFTQGQQYELSIKNGVMVFGEVSADA